MMAPCRAEVGLIEVIAGTWSTVKLFDDVAVDEPTDTLIRPVVAPDGTIAVRLLVVAAVTFAAVPLNWTVLLPGVALKFWPWMVTVVPTPPCCGVKLRIARALGEGRLEREIESRLPTAS